MEKFKSVCKFWLIVFLKNCFGLEVIVKSGYKIEITSFDYNEIIK